MLLHRLLCNQDEDQKLIKKWVAENKEPMGAEMNFRSTDVQAYIRILPTIKLHPMEDPKER